jgi:hypothetical protein
MPDLNGSGVERAASHVWRVSAGPGVPVPPLVARGTGGLLTSSSGSLSMRGMTQELHGDGRVEGLLQVASSSSQKAVGKPANR